MRHGSDRFLTGHHPELGAMWAAINPEARFVPPELKPSRFAATLSPYRTREAALAALSEAGARIGEVEPGGQA